MFEELFTGRIALARQHECPFPEERRQFLRHLKDLGYARNTLHAVACELVSTQLCDVGTPMPTQISAHTRSPPHNCDHHINHRRLDVGVTHQLLDRADVVTGGEQVSGEGVTVMPRAA